jgi:hypothetical protein
VGFSSQQTEIIEHTMDDGTTLASVQQRLAPTFTTSNARTNGIFTRLKLPVPSHTKNPTKEATKEARESLKLLIDTMVQINPTAILYKYKQSNLVEKDACARSTHLPTTITGLQSYMNGFHPKPEGGAMWGAVRIGFNSNPDNFFINLYEEGNMHDFWTKKSPLQTVKTEYCVFLYLSVESMHPEDFAIATNQWIQLVAPKLKRAPLIIAFEHRAIWDDGPKSNDLPPKQRRAKKALHVACKKGFGESAQAWTRTFLKSKAFQHCYRVPMRFIPQFKRGHGETYNNKHARAVEKHMKITTFGVCSATTMDLRDIDSPCDLIDGSPTRRQLILGLPLHNTNTQPATTKQNNSMIRSL